MPSLAHYMAQYDHGQESGSNKFLQRLGISAIFAGVFPPILMKLHWGSVFFLVGWVLLFLGHRIEGNPPAFFHESIYLLVGPISVGQEAWVFLTGSTPTSDAISQGDRTT